MSSGSGFSLTLPKELYDKLKRRAEGSEFRSVEDYVLFVLGEVVSDEGAEPKGMDSEDEERVKDNLRALGYI